MLTIQENEILINLLPNDIYLLIIDALDILTKLEYDNHSLDIEDIFINIDNEKSDLKARLMDLLSIHINVVGSRLGIIFSIDSLLSTRVSILKNILSLDDIEYELRLKLLEDMNQVDGDNVDIFVKVIDEFVYSSNSDLFYDIDNVKLTLLQSIKNMLKSKDIEVDNKFLTDILKKNKIKNIVSKLVYLDDKNRETISTFTKDLELDTSIHTILKYFRKDLLEVTDMNTYLSIVIYILAYSSEGRSNPMKTYVEFILPIISNSIDISSEIAMTSLITRLTHMLEEEKINA